MFWQPIWNLLEDRFALVLVNAHPIKQVPGRKTDVGDCEWIADLLRHGLLKGSFVPDRAQRELRELTRYRTALLQERAAFGTDLHARLLRLAEVGTDLERFATASHLASWAGLCPGNNESAGKRKSGKTRKGNPNLRTALVEAAQAAARKRDSYLSAQYRRLAARRGKKKAIIALGHTLLITAYHVLKRRVEFQDLGPTYFDDRNRTIVERRLVRRLEGLGYKVNLQPAVA